MSFEFEWDPDKADANRDKHAVTFDEALGVFADPLERIFDDPNHGIMKKASKSRRRVDDDEPRGEYDFDYRRSRPNRFASRMTGNTVAVVLEPDVAQVFGSSESVNQFLRSVISALPARRLQTRRKAG